MVSKGIERNRYMLREEIMLQRQLITHKIKHGHMICCWKCINIFSVSPKFWGPSGPHPVS